MFFIGDIHGCLDELKELLIILGFMPPKFNHFQNKKAIFVGDLVDRGPSSFEVFNLVRQMVNQGSALAVRGNHDDKLMRYYKGINVVQSHGLDKTIIEFKNNNAENVAEFISSLPYYLTFDNVVVTHASWKEKYWQYDNYNKNCRSWCLFGPNNGIKEDGFPDRIDWAGKRVIDYNSPIIVYGHQPYKNVRCVNKTYGIDTGCVFGNRLSALKYPEMEIVSVLAKQTYADGKVMWC